MDLKIIWHCKICRGGGLIDSKIIFLAVKTKCNEIVESEYRERPLVSIVIPVYNEEKYIGECLDSVLAQTFHNIEVICVDDASTDNSLNILEKYSMKDERIRVIRNEKNEGQAFSRNRGFAAVGGKYTYYLDSDDCIERNAIEKLYQYAEQYETECIFFNSTIMRELEAVGKGPSLSYGLKEIDKKVCDGPSLFTILIDKNLYTSSLWRRFWRTDFLVRNEIKFAENLRTSEDGPYSLKAILCSKRVMVVDENYHIYRRHEGSLTTEAGVVKMKSSFRGCCMMMDFWRNHQFETVVDDALNRYLKELLINVKRMYLKNKGRVNRDIFTEGMEQYLFEVLIIQEYEKYLNYIDKTLLQEINKHKYVIVYGAYKYAAEVVEKLERNGIQIFSLAVTQMHEKAEGINDIPVHEIKDLCYMKNDAIVVLGVDKKNREDVIATLKKHGFMNYISLD